MEIENITQRIGELSKYELIKLYNQGKIRKLSDCEVKILRIFWDTKEPISTLDLQQILVKKFNKKWCIQTISTYLMRLQRKGYVVHSKKGRYSYWWYSISKETYREWMTLDLLNLFKDTDDLQKTLNKITTEINTQNYI